MWIKDKSKRSKYYEKTQSRPLSALLEKALKLGNFRTALELGCGAGADVREMAARGMKVTAVDINPEIEKFFGKSKNINLAISPFENFDFGKYDLIHSKSSLVFLPHESFGLIIRKIKKSLNKNGVFVARFWGIHDSANNGTHNWTFVAKNEIEKMFSGYEIKYLEENQFDGKTALGKPKYWHFIDIIAKKK